MITILFSDFPSDPPMGLDPQLRHSRTGLLSVSVDPLQTQRNEASSNHQPELFNELKAVRISSFSECTSLCYPAYF